MSELIGVEFVPVHADLVIVESNMLHGNMDPRFSEHDDFTKNRAELAGLIACSQVVTMAPKGQDHIRDLSQPHAAMPQEYTMWSDELKPTEPQHYKPTSNQTIDLPCDGFVTAKPGQVVALNNADCPAVLMYNPHTKVLGNAHSGRGGTLLEIGTTMLDEFIAPSKYQAKDVIVHVTSGISAESNLMHTLPDAMTTEAWRSFIEQDKQTKLYTVDLVGYALKQLQLRGVSRDNMTASSVDTVTNPNYFSHRAGGDKADGRNGVMAAIKPGVVHV